MDFYAIGFCFNVFLYTWIFSKPSWPTKVDLHH